MGNVLQAGEGQAPARQAALGAGIPNCPDSHGSQSLRLWYAGADVCRQRH